MAPVPERACRRARHSGLDPESHLLDLLHNSENEHLTTSLLAERSNLSKKGRDCFAPLAITFSELCKKSIIKNRLRLCPCTLNVFSPRRDELLVEDISKN